MSLPAPLQYLAWDSDFLGFPVARFTASGLAFSAISEAVAVARQAGCRLLYVIIAPDDAAEADALRQVGAGLVDRKVTYAVLLPSYVTTSISPAIGDASGYSPQLESLAWQSGEYSRFRLDLRFKPGVFQELYSRWLCNSLSGEIARRVLVWRSPESQEAGLLTLGEKNDRADIGLLAVDATMRGQRVGQQLVAAAHAQAIIWGYTTLQVVTQGDNVSACRFYEKCGFIPENDIHIYHLWLD